MWAQSAVPIEIDSVGLCLGSFLEGLALQAIEELHDSLVILAIAEGGQREEKGEVAGSGFLKWPIQSLNAVSEIAAVSENRLDSTSASRFLGEVTGTNLARKRVHST